MTKIFGVKIDVEKRSVEEVYLNSRNILEDLYFHTNCDCVTTVQINKDHDLILDDCGMLKSNRKMFKLNGYEFAGNAIILSINKNGEWKESKLGVMDILGKLEFLGEVKDEDVNIPVPEFFSFSSMDDLQKFLDEHQPKHLI